MWAASRDLDSAAGSPRGCGCFGVLPSERRRGLASWALPEMLEEARRLGMDRVLITCRVTNAAFRRTIEKCGGVFEDIPGYGEDAVRRYWVGR